MNGEYVCELVRAHYARDEARFEIILSQLIHSEFRLGRRTTAVRLNDLQQSSRKGQS